MRAAARARPCARARSAVVCFSIVFAFFEQRLSERSPPPAFVALEASNAALRVNMSDAVRSVDLYCALELMLNPSAVAAACCGLVRAAAPAAAPCSRQAVRLQVSVEVTDAAGAVVYAAEKSACPAATLTADGSAAAVTLWSPYSVRGCAGALVRCAARARERLRCGAQDGFGVHWQDDVLAALVDRGAAYDEPFAIHSRAHFPSCAGWSADGASLRLVRARARARA